MDDKTLARFWAKVNKEGPVPVHCPELGPCWEWTAYLNKWGYGSFKLDGRMEYAHRVAYSLANALPEGVRVLHRCDNPRCVRGAHLKSGTDLDNSRDRDAKGRMAHGVTHGRAKLTPQTVRAARTARAAGATYRSLATKYGVDAMTMWNAVNFKTWKSV